MGAETRIHFVCTGNVYRSRLAEAYCASKGVPGIRVSSSGIEAGRYDDASISPHAAQALARHGLERYVAPRWQRTTSELIRSSDVVVFMEEEHLRFCAEWIEPGRQRVEVWEIEDIWGLEVEEIPEEVERTFARIRGKADRLLETLEASVKE